MSFGISSPTSPSMTSISPSMCALRRSFDTPGRSAYSVMPSLSSITSTGGSSAGCSPACACVTRLSVWAIGFSLSVDLNAPRLSRLLAPDAHVQHAVTVGRAHLVRVDVVGERDHAVKAADEALVQVHARALLFLRERCGALARDAEHAALDLHVD